MKKRTVDFNKIKRVVIKVGTSVLTNDEGLFSLSALKQVVTQVEWLLKTGREVVVVSSGAIGCGMQVLSLKKRPKELKLLQACAAIGQGKLMKAYEDYFSKSGHHTAQILLTRNSFQDWARCVNIQNTLLELLRVRAVSIVNENDTVSTEEIRFGDNDTLSISVSELIQADLLVLLSDVDGIYLNGNRDNVVSEVSDMIAIDELFKHVFSHEKKVVTAGGMKTKLEVSKRAMKNGISTIVMNGKEKNGLKRLFAGESLGTIFVAPKVDYGFKKNWLVDLTRAHGNLTIDNGAHEAIIKNGKSLLPSGVVAIEGHFKAGDSIQISAGGKTFAKGITNYASDELARIKGKNTSEIQETLGYKHSDEVIHRDNLVILG